MSDSYSYSASAGKVGMPSRNACGIVLADVWKADDEFRRVIESNLGERSMEVQCYRFLVTLCSWNGFFPFTQTPTGHPMEYQTSA